MNNLSLLFSVGILLVIILYFFKKNNDDNVTNKINEKFKKEEKPKLQKKVTFNDELNQTTSFSTKKILKYFGSHSCPHSNAESNTYKIVNEGLRNYINKNNLDVDIEIYWSGPENRSQFQAANAQYVPAMTNATFKQVDFKITPDNLEKNIDDYEQEEFDNIVFKSFISKL
jgi:hypothetical protein